MPALDQVRNLVRDLVKDLAPPDPPKEEPAVDENPFKTRTDQTITTFTWVIGALAAVASLVIAGTQLSSIGRLDWEQDRARLLTAAASAAVALALVVAAVALAAWVRLPGKMVDPVKLKQLAAKDPPSGKTDVEFLERVAGDEYYNQGQNGLAALLEACDAADLAYKTAKAQVGTPNLAAAEKEVTKYRRGLTHATWLYAYMRFQQRTKVATLGTFVLAGLVSGALVTLAWAANPPVDPDAAGAATAPRPVAAVLRLADADAIWDQALGAACAAAARSTEGIAVIALATDEDGTVSGVTVPTGPCPTPQPFAVASDEGVVTSDGDGLGETSTG